MNRLRKPPSKETQECINLCDHNITKVKIHNNALFFFFEKGFDFCTDQEEIRTKEGVVIFENYEDLVVKCCILKTRPSHEGLCFRGKAINISRLNHYFRKGKLSLEIGEEKYYKDEVLWFASFRSPKGYVSHKGVIIQILDCKTMTYLWE